MHENDGLARLPLALVQAGSFIRNETMSFEEHAVLYQGKRSDLSEVLEAVLDSVMMRSGQRVISTTRRVSIEALDAISRRTIGAVAILGIGEVPERLMRRVANERVRAGRKGMNRIFSF